MENKAAYYGMLHHLHRLEAAYGVGVLKNSEAQLAEIIGDEYRADYEAIKTYGEQFQATSFDEHTLKMMEQMIKRGLMVSEMADLLQRSVSMIRNALHTHPKLQQVYCSTQNLRQQRSRQKQKRRRKIIGKRIAIIRQAKGLSPVEFAKEIGVNESHLSQQVIQWESGVYLPMKKYRKNIARLANTTEEEIFSTED